MRTSVAREQGKAVVAKYLYVTYAGVVRRYTLKGGVPSAHSDHTYNVTDPIATDGNGALYARSGDNVAVFPDGSFTPSRILMLTEGPYPYPGALGIDRDGFVFVTSYVGSAARFGARALGSWPSCQASALEVFGPNSDASAQPIVCYKLSPYTMAFDDDDDLFFILLTGPALHVLSKARSGGGGTIEQISSPNMPSPVAVASAAGQLYVAITGSHGWLIDVFPTTARGETMPTRVIYPPRGAFPTSVECLAVDANYLYVGGIRHRTIHGQPAADLVLTVLDRLANGHAKAVSVSTYRWVKGSDAPTAAVGR
jgi:hypothetical protein